MRYEVIQTGTLYVLYTYDHSPDIQITLIGKGLSLMQAKDIHFYIAMTSYDLYPTNIAPAARWWAASG